MTTLGDDGAARRSALSGLDRASTMSLELLAGILVWGGVGWLLDGWLGTQPWLLGVGVLGGFAAGLYLVWLRTNEPRTQTRGERRREAERR